MKSTRKVETGFLNSELLILPDGRNFAHTIATVVERVLSELNPEDKLMRRRASVSNRRDLGRKKCKPL